VIFGRHLLGVLEAKQIDFMAGVTGKKSGVQLSYARSSLSS